MKKREAEQLIAQLLLVCDRLGATKEQHEFLGFRRRLRLFCADPSDLYREHMKDTVERLPRYRAWLEHGEHYEDAHKVHRLWEILKDMMEGPPVFSTCTDDD